MSSLGINFLGVDFKNPLVTSSGCFGFGMEYKDYFDPNILGGIGIKGLTLEPRDGNYGTRIAETPSGMLNCVGLENPGIEYFKKVTLPLMKKEGINTNIIANINGSTIEDYIKIAKEVENIPEIKIIELNISCPNVKDGGMAFGANPEVAGRVTKEVRNVTTKPLVVKLSPNVTDIAGIAKIVEENGADAISLINTVLGMAIDIRSKKPLLGNTFGGLSGPAVKPIALRMVYQVYKAVKIPIIGMGGIASPEDALEFIMAGATLVSVGSVIFPNPLLPVEIIEGMEKYCKDNGIANISELIGIVHR
ncbi:Dihydroorotate dehydrogenase B (NAD(+)), catalytic subunit [Fusobacterium sp. DD29]|uniref:dihydroorotate dehydrogenase n=1 Tax=unclassified Fusobacterium TaxID=2648384 RepID=UPI001B8B69F2|nr:MULTISPECIES: dihydroorotate dehydrogenase [unclassified Fusobacterium]MBR8701776.1 Dihydroorotate dehydrogenase B (NAD(+)), catalytic subunit [Fusobacterium sp. DD45]MBR8711549.1 Dihydroorotate dehydrogenase B (NAD(+)), catalytic subunit [Fusobacterium sp. DD28]MBR8749763.1 Dihydroorotate dehydrogenase B (NAD(+)), catalytic subunit [Fusobacterium sp. DD29]MBR8752098.1 Dihydroorotate dehydrogenase B (NAD(+)), catalytic subunit [Fusobacterium sp. DD26]MBR8762014.1 Dihydroorotate dehydrogenas